MKETLTVAFYRPEGDNEPLINRLTSFLTGQFVHCELLFRDPSTGRQNLASGVWQGELVFLKTKTFGRTSWSFKNIQITSKQADTMREFCANAAQKKTPFNKLGLLRCCTPFPRPTDHTCYFCSELAICAFQSAGLFESAIASMVTPSGLYDMLNDFNSHSTATPLLQERIQRKGLKFAFAGQNAAAKSVKKQHLKTSWTSFSKK